MEPLTLGEIAAAIGTRLHVDGSAVVRGVCTDTRQGCAGTVFFALSGERSDGHAYVRDAAKAGAVAAVVQRPVDDAPIPQLVVNDTLRALGDLARWYGQRFDIAKVGVTGSVGKTSVRSMTAAVLSARFNVCESERNHNNEIGVPLTVLSLEGHHTAAVVEMAMRGRGQIAYLADIVRPCVGVVTKIGVSHIELLGSQANIAAAKAELLEALPADGAAVLPAEDPFLPFLRERAQAAGVQRLITFGRSDGADVRCTEPRVTRDGRTHFRLNDVAFELRSPGVHFGANAAAACAVGLSLGVTLDDAAERLREWTLPEMRLTLREAPRSISVLDDSYNAAPDSVSAALDTLVRMANAAGRRAVAVLGDMKELGAYSKEAHASLGRSEAVQSLGLLVTIGADAALIAEASDGVPVRRFDTTDDAANAVHRLLHEGDIVLVKGSRVMAMEKIVNAILGGNTGET
jgi:UDP-N-acetylmuramoyl-tripeptide--D-alanyl-D-alanine ligase